MFKWIKEKIDDYRYNKKIKSLPVWCRKRLSLDREIVLGDKCILSYDFSEQIERNKR